MASIQVRKETGRLIVDFYYRGIRCREQTALGDSPTNRAKVERLIERIEAEIAAGTFEYRRYFPASRNLAKFRLTPMESAVVELASAVAPEPHQPARAPAKPSPTFREFCETWYTERQVEWRRSYRATIRTTIDAYLLPRFGEQPIAQITKANILAFRAELANSKGRGRDTLLSATRINGIMKPLRQIMNEAADRFEFRSAFLGIKRLKVRRSDVKPFSIEEVRQILEAVRPDFRDYFLVRFFTGMRTGEIDGLRWKYVDFERRLILIRETVVDGETEYTKTDESQREIQMSGPVYDALRRMHAATGSISEWVFCNRDGRPLAHRNVTNRVWYPLLRHLGLELRRPYQTRHSAATLWLASGENPEWVARQLGHANTEMLFRVYSRFVPNVTRRDGSAFEALIGRQFETTSVAIKSEGDHAR